MTMTYEVENTSEPPPCQCCGGSGMHGYRPHVSPSPDDDDAECSTCGGKGVTWFNARQNSCSGYRTLMRRRR